MKWTDKQIQALRELCEKGTPNKDIATILQCNVSDVYAKRSQLGITIPKVKAAKEADKQPTDPWVPIKAAFDRLDMALLEAASEDKVNAQTLQQVAAGISVFKSLLLDAMR